MTDDMMSEFVAEASDHLARAEEILLGLSRHPDQPDAEAINACFRSLHTIKGCSGFLDLNRIQHLAHTGEQVLDALRTGELRGSTAVFDALLATVARLQAQVAVLSGQDLALPSDDADCVAQLDSVRGTSATSVPATATAPAAAVEDPALAAIGEALAELVVAGDDASAVRAVLEGLARHLLQGTWAADARALMTRMRHLAGDLDGPAGKERVREIAALCTQLERAQRALLAGEPARPTGVVQVVEGAGAALGEFVIEAGELLTQAEATVVGRQRFTSDQVNSVFRAFHTIKGMAAYLALPEVEHAAHAHEAQIQRVRDGQAPADEGFAAVVLVGVDALRELVQGVKRRLAVGVTTSSPSPSPSPSAAPDAQTEHSSSPRLGDLLTDLGVPRAVVEQTAASLKPGERIGDKLVAEGAATRQQVDKAASAQQALKSGAEGFSRVATAKLDELMNQVGELLIAQAMVQHHPDLSASPTLAQAVSRQGRILRNLQVLSLSLRMVPLRGTFQKMARVVYDTARKLGKQVELSLGGEDTEIDRTLAEAMGDPLMHMVRNAIDHGIEMPDVRTARGKTAAGRLRLEAFQAGDDVVIRLSDDGAGMDPQRLRAKAIEKGLIDPTQVLDDQACFQLVFLPGFSTAAKVTDVSGRGVGMDVVRRQVESADGTVQIDSTPGSGTTFTIRLPMTTAILDAMLLQVGREHLLMPISSIVEMLRPQSGQVQTILDRGRMIQHRQRMLPLVHLGDVLGISGCIEDPHAAILVVIENRGSDFVLQVDAILGQRQVVIKPIDDGLRHHPGTSGTTILGDGRVALILNPNCLVPQHADQQTIQANQLQAQGSP